MDDEKHVDESWKDAVANEKELQKEAGASAPEGQEEPLAPEAEPQEGEMPEINFISYITSLAFQTMIFLGEIPNPMTEKVEKNLHQAKFIIDTLLMLKEKTTGNLTDPEKNAIEGFLYELQMKYVEAVEKEV